MASKKTEVEVLPAEEPTDMVRWLVRQAVLGEYDSCIYTSAVSGACTFKIGPFDKGFFPELEGVEKVTLGFRF